MKRNNLYSGLVTPSSGWWSPIIKILILVRHLNSSLWTQQQAAKRLSDDPYKDVKKSSVDVKTTESRQKLNDVAVASNVGVVRKSKIPKPDSKHNGKLARSINKRNEGTSLLEKTFILNKMIYDNDYSSIIDIYFYETFSTLTQTFSACAQLLRHPVRH